MKSKLRMRSSAMAARGFQLKAGCATSRHHRVKFSMRVLRLRSDAGENPEPCSVAAEATPARSARRAKYSGHAPPNRASNACAFFNRSQEVKQTARYPQEVSTFWPHHANSYEREM